LVAQLAQTANFLGYFCMAIPAALVMRRWGMAQFGSAAASERRLNFAQAFNPPGTILGVVIGARFIFSE
jgi:FHS family L-fucose permease-like MFS transporter